MKSTFFASVLLLGTMASPVMAQNGDVSPATGGPVMLSAVQMDTVRGGQLIEIDRTLNNNNVAVAVPVNAGVSANVCVVAGTCVAATNAEQERPGRIRQD
jgi:hypothetical protein